MCIDVLLRIAEADASLEGVILKLKHLIGISSLLVVCSAAHAVTFSASQGALSAQVDFTIDSGNLKVVLTNKSTADCMVPTDILCGVFFNGTPALTPISALVSAGSNTYKNTTLVSGPGADVGGAWAYASGFAPVSGATQGIGAAGFGLYGPTNVFPGANVDGDPGVDGVSYGLTSAGDDLNTHNGGINNRELTKNSVTFVLSGIPQNFNLNSISTVSFQYGTDLSETRLVTPEPCSILALGGLLALRLRKKK